MARAHSAALACAAVAAALLLGGCRSAGGGRTPASSATPHVLSATDDLGKTVALARPARRIVSLSPAATETLFAIGVGDKLVGVTEFCDYPPQAKAIEKVGGYLDPSVEKVAAAAPDLIVAQRGTSSEVLAALEEIGAPLFVLDPKTYDDVVAGIERLAVLTAAPLAGRVVREMRRVAAEVAARLRKAKPKSRPLVLLGDPHLADEAGLWLPGGDTLHHDLIVRAGGRNIAGDVSGGWQALSLEVVLQRAPEVIVATRRADEDAEDKRREVLRALRAAPGWAGTPAVREGRVYVIEENVLLRPGPRLAEALWALARFFHPKLFPEEAAP